MAENISVSLSRLLEIFDEEVFCNSSATLCWLAIVVKFKLKLKSVSISSLMRALFYRLIYVAPNYTFAPLNKSVCNFISYFIMAFFGVCNYLNLLSIWLLVMQLHIKLHRVYFLANETSAGWINKYFFKANTEKVWLMWKSERFRSCICAKRFTTSFRLSQQKTRISLPQIYLGGLMFGMSKNIALWATLSNIVMGCPPHHIAFLLCQEKILIFPSDDCR